MSSNVVDLRQDESNDHQSTVFRIFNSFVNELPNILGGGQFKYPEPAVDMEIQDDKLAIYCPGHGILRFEDVPYKRGSSDENLHICVRFQQTIRGVDIDGEVKYEVIKSTARTTYLRILSEDGNDGRYKAEIKHGMHYDFDRIPDDNHPIFHVQYDPRSIDIELLERHYHLPKQGRLDDRYPQSPRVPTAPIDVGGAVHMILRQCMSQDEFDWPGKLENKLGELPTFPHDCFEPEPQDGESLVPEWWYVHCTDGQTHVPTDLVNLRTRNWE